MKRQKLISLLALINGGVVLVALFIGGPGLATFGLAFTYQNYLTQNDTPLDGVDQCDMIFSL